MQKYVLCFLWYAGLQCHAGHALAIMTAISLQKYSMTGRCSWPCSVQFTLSSGRPQFAYTSVVSDCFAAHAGLLTLQCEKDTAYGLTLVWSLVAVYAKHKHVQSIMVVSLIGIVLLGVASAAAIVQKQRQRKYSPMHGGLGESLQG